MGLLVYESNIHVLDKIRHYNFSTQTGGKINVNKKVQLDATICRHLFTAKSLYMFRVSQHPSSGVLKTVSATSGIGHDAGTATPSTVA